MDRLGEYLHIPTGYAPFLEGLRWSDCGTAIEYADGQTFVFAPQLALFLEGLATERGPVHLGFVLHLLALLGLGKGAVQAADLARAFQETGRNLRNAGALAAVLCRRVPPPAHPPDVGQLCRRLNSPALMAEFAWFQRLHPYDIPDSVAPWAAAPFEALVLQALADLSPEDLRHWLRHGRGPLESAGREVARALPAARPRTLAHALAELTRHRRVAGAVPFVAQLTGALALPPRRLAHHELPMGGYADVAARGHPEQLLPSQFILEDPPAAGPVPARPGSLSLEFVRRYAENELLYFRREEPHAQVREELVLLLDQGVRTWGNVRLVLTAAVLAFGKRAERRRLPLWLAATSSEGHLLDPLRAEPEALATLIEASDLSANPGLALECVLEERAAAAREDQAASDVVLLTHPRNLAEADVAAAARRVPPGARLFAVAVDGQGAVLLAELKHGTPVKINQFRVDLSRPVETPAPSLPSEARAPWRGDVEPVPFPFRFGVTARGPSPLFAFDHAGEWVLQLSHNGLLHAWRCDGSALEVLPRGYVNGAVLTHVEAVRGVAGGFVVGGLLRGELAAVHYDFTRRSCAVHLLGQTTGPGRWQWFYFPDLHCVTALTGQEQHGRPACVCAVDLGTGAQHRRLQPDHPEASNRVAEARRRAEQQPASAPFVPIVDENRPATGSGPFLRLDRAAGRLTLEGANPPWMPFVPVADGRPVLTGARLLFAQCRGNVLAVDCYYPDPGGQRVLRLFRGPDGTTVGELVQPPRLPGHIALAPDGRRLAREVGRCEIEVRDLDAGLRLVAATPRGKCHQGVAVELGEMWLTLRAGHSVHLLRWDRGVLDCGFSIGDRDQLLRRQLAGTSLASRGARAIGGGLPAFVHYDRQRFQAAAHDRLIAVVDVYGHVALFERTGALVAIFFAFRSLLAGWLPDGTRFGPVALLGGPPTPDAARRIGAALHEAWCSNEVTE
jgi:hypothetical protein